ncbi:MAG: DUF3303 family protein [Candidatus Bathyarchaeia archaeon]
MLFLIRHTHSPERCPGAKGPEAGKKFMASVSEDAAAKAGVKVVGSYIAPTEHMLLFVVDAKDLKSVEAFTFGKLALVGNTKITPVMRMKEAAAALPKFVKK